MARGIADATVGCVFPAANGNDIADIRGVKADDIVLGVDLIIVDAINYDVCKTGKRMNNSCDISNAIDSVGGLE
eukprot:scaffold10055_cov63-Cyclotella_meneghiniana.AAC.7